MNLTGKLRIGGEAILGDRTAIYGINPATNEQLDPAYPGGNESHVDAAAGVNVQAGTLIDAGNRIRAVDGIGRAPCPA